MTVLELLGNKREEVLRVAAEHGAHDLRVFGSTVRGDADADSDIDLLVTLEPGVTSNHMMSRDEDPTLY